jgi:hypothetical protein
MAAKTVMMTTVVVVVSILLICMSGSVSAHTHKTHNVTFFFQESILVPNPTGLVVAGPGGDLTKLQQGVMVNIYFVKITRPRPNWSLRNPNLANTGENCKINKFRSKLNIRFLD